MQDTQEQHTDEYPPQEQTEEPSVIEGEVMTTIILDPPPVISLPQKRSSFTHRVFVVSWVLVTLLLLGILVCEHVSSLVAVFFTPTATITISPDLVTLKRSILLR